MPLHAAISGKEPALTVEYIVSRDKSIVNMADESGVTPLFLAVYTGNTDVCVTLLKAGADPLKCSTKVSPLHICAERGFVEIAAALLEKAPALVNEVDEVGNSALHVACDWDQIKVIKLICDYGNENLILVKNQEGKTAVEVAYESNTQEAYPYLCDKYKLSMSWSTWCSVL